MHLEQASAPRNDFLACAGFFQCLPGFSSPSPVIPAGPQKSKDPCLCDIAATSAGLLKLKSYNFCNPIHKKEKLFSCEAYHVG